ncbi:MAG: hypothetical protein QW638_03320 [Candidatus Bathyarchaeia archaeon]
MKVKRRNLVLTAMLSALITASLFIQVDRLSALAEDGHSRLWKGEVKVLNSEPNFGWWLKGYESDIWSHRWRPVADALTSAVRKQGRFREIFCNIFMNSFNDTIFVVLIDLNESIVNEVLDAMKPPPGITVKFLKGDAPLYQLEEWLSLINPEELDRMGIQWSGICITENATILITLEIVTPEYVETITQLIKDKIPPGIITIAKMERPKLCSQPDRIRPLEAGIQVQSFFQGQGTTSTLNFLGIARNTNTEGAIVVGHGSSVGANVYQPTVNPNNLIGQTNINPIRQRFSDAAWVPLNPGVDGENLIYDPNINIWERKRWRWPILTIFSIGFLAMMFYISSENSSTPPYQVVKPPAPFPGVKVPFEVVARAWSARNITLFLPTILPNGLKPIAAYVVIDKSGNIGNVAIFLYSNKSRDRIETAELAIEVYPAEDLPFDPKSTKGGVFTTINGWKVYYNEEAFVGHEEYQQLYGPYARLISVYINGRNYLYGGAPPLTIQDMIKIVESMKPMKTS